MKPRYRPGKPATSGSKARDAVAKAKPLSPSQMSHLKGQKYAGANPKAGRKGKRASWDIDYAEGVKFDTMPMPCREPESFTIDGTRRRPKRGGR